MQIKSRKPISFQAFTYPSAIAGVTGPQAAIDFECSLCYDLWKSKLIKSLFKQRWAAESQPTPAVVR